MRLRTAMLYMSWALLSFIVLTVLMFPEDKVGKTASWHLSRLSNGIDVSMKTVRLSLPFSLVAPLPVLTLNSGDTFTFDYLSLTPDFSSLISGPPAAWYSTGIKKGFVHGRISRSGEGKTSLISMTCDLDGLMFKDVSYSLETVGIEASFQLDGRNEIDIAGSGSIGGLGTLTLKQVKIQIDEPFLASLKLSDLDFMAVTLSYTLQDDTVIITEMNAEGPQAQIRGTGDILVRFPASKSVLNVEGYIQPAPAMISRLARLSSVALLFQDVKSQGIPFTITGTVEKPVFGL